MSYAKKGLFCVFEGIDGVGKSTLIQALATRLHLRYSPQKVIVLQEPTLLPGGKKIRELLSAKAQRKAEEWLALFVKDRRQNLKKNIEPAYRAGKLILQDRYFYSTAAYQGTESGGSLSPASILSYNRRQGFWEPDLLFFIALAPELALERIQRRRFYKGKESFENLEHLKAVAANYRGILPESTIQLDGNLPLDALCTQALAYF